MRPKGGHTGIKTILTRLSEICSETIGVGVAMGIGIESTLPYFAESIGIVDPDSDTEKASFGTFF